jgi:hypothetical protein
MASCPQGGVKPEGLRRRIPRILPSMNPAYNIEKVEAGGWESERTFEVDRTWEMGAPLRTRGSAQIYPSVNHCQMEWSTLDQDRARGPVPTGRSWYQDPPFRSMPTPDLADKNSQDFQHAPIGHSSPNKL